MDMNVLSAVQNLISFHIDPTRIVIFCEKGAINCANDPHVNATIATQLRELKVQLHEGYQMHEWNRGQWTAGQSLRLVTFQHVKEKNELELKETVPVKITILCCVSIHIRV